MSRRPAAAFVIAALLTCSLATAARADEATVTAEKQVSERVVDLTIRTNAFTEPTVVEVFLPAGYDTDRKRRWPVTYFTAGTMNNYDTFRKLVHGDKLVRDYPAIVVSPDSNSGYWSDWYNGGAFGPPKYETFVIDQLIPLIDARYRTLPGRAHRFVFGVSMGGYGSMMFAAKHPDLFSAAATLSGAVDSNLPANGAVLSMSSTFDGAAPDAIYGPRAEQEVRWRGHNPWDLAANLRGMDVQVRTANGVPNPGIGENPASADGVSCIVEGGVHMASVNFHTALDTLGIKHLWNDYGPGCHTPPNFTREVTDTLEVFTKLLADPPPAPAALDYRSIEPHVHVSGWTVDADPARALEWLHVEAGRAGVTLTGSGTTTVATPAWYRGLKAVDVHGTAVAPGRDGRLRFAVDLGAAHTVQQYTPGAPTDFVTKKVALAPHAVVRITRASRVRAGVRVCVRARGGEVRDARITAGGRTVRADIGTRTLCRTLATRRARSVTISGQDRFGHPVLASARAR